MTVNKIVVVECDARDFEEDNPFRSKRCLATFHGEVAEPRDVVIHRVKNAGWSVKDGGASHYCPVHTITIKGAT